MSHRGFLFVTETVRDEMESEYKNKVQQLRESGYYVEVRETQTSLSERNDPVQYPEKMKGEVCVREEGNDNSIEVGKVCVYVGLKRFPNTAGFDVRGIVEGLCVFWDDELIDKIT